MVQLTNNKTTYRIILENNKKVNVRDIYNRIFFSTFGLEGIRIYSHEYSFNTQYPEEIQNEIEAPKIANDTFIDIFGKEQYPSGYSDLPLPKKKEITDDDDNKIEDNEEGGVYEFLQEYVSGYTGNSNKTITDSNENRVEISIPLDINFPVLSLENIYTLDNSHNISYLFEKNISYDVLNQIIQDIYLQINYFTEKGYYYNEIPINSVLLIQQKYIIFSIETVVVLDKNDTDHFKQRNTAFLKFIQKFLGSSDNNLDDVLEKIQYTNLYYFIKRIRDESVFLLLN